MKISVTDIVDKLKKHLSAVALMAALFLGTVIIIAVIALAGDTASTADEWGEGITENIPPFEGEDEQFAFGSDGSYAAAYYNGVSGDAATEYIALLEEQLSVEFSGENYPRTAIYGEKIITVHYNAAEMKMSVTISQENIEESTKSGEEQ